MTIFVLATLQVLLVQLFLIVIGAWYMAVSKTKFWIIALFLMFTLGTYGSHNFSVNEFPLTQKPVGFIIVNMDSDFTSQFQELKEKLDN